MTKRRSPYFTGKPFTVEVCDQLRHHVGTRTALDSKRRNAFDDRDAAVAEMNEASNRNADMTEFQVRHSAAVLEIANLDAQVKWHSNRIKQLIEDPDQTEFTFMLDMSEDQDAVAPKAPKPAEDKTKALFTAQTPDPKPAKGKKAPEPKVPEGEHQHMLAAVKELDLRDDLKGKLVKASLGTVGAVSMFIEGKGDLCERANVTPAAAEAITKAVMVWIKKHTRAELEQSREVAKR